MLMAYSVGLKLQKSEENLHFIISHQVYSCLTLYMKEESKDQDIVES